MRAARRVREGARGKRPVATPAPRPRAYLTTALREAKSAIRGAGRPPGRCSGRAPRTWSARNTPPGSPPPSWSAASPAQAARPAAPARKGRRAGQPVQPREISFTAARRAAITGIRNGDRHRQPARPLTTARRQATLRDLGKRRVTIDRDRHRDRKTKARQAFPAAGRGTATRKAPATITICGPLAA